MLIIFQLELAPLVNRHFQVSPELYDWAQVRSLAGPHSQRSGLWRFVSKPILHCLCRGIGVFILLDSEPSTQSEVLSTRDQIIFIEKTEELTETDLGFIRRLISHSLRD